VLVKTRGDCRLGANRSRHLPISKGTCIRSSHLTWTPNDCTAAA